MNDYEKHKNLSREDYDLHYEYFKYHGWKSISDSDDLEYPKVYSYIKVSDLKYLRNNGKKPDNKYPAKLAEVKEVSYDATMGTKEAFSLLKLAMHTKSGALRKSMENLKPYEEYMIISLINYMRECWVEKEEVLQLSWQEFYFLKQGGFKKNPKKKSK